MEGQIVHDASSRKRNRQQISVPFLWEDKPGTPKSEWPVNFPPVDPLLPLSPPPQSPLLGVVLPSRPPPPPPGVVMPSCTAPLSPPPGVVLPSRPPPGPAKFIVSVPFKWEEKPGTPLRSFAPEPPRPAVGENLPLPPAYSHLLDWFESEAESASDDEDDEDELDWLAELDQTVGSTSSAPTLLANRLVATSTMSSAVPFDSSDSSPESGGSTSSYATGSTSPEGSSILEQLFPLYKPRKLENTNEKNRWIGMKDEANEARFKGLKGGRNRSMIRRPPTLGELIMLSKRRSFVQKAVHMRKNSFSKEMEDDDAIGCFMFGSGRGGIAKMLARKSLLSLNLT